MVACIDVYFSLKKDKCTGRLLALNSLHAKVCVNVCLSFSRILPRGFRHVLVVIQIFLNISQ